MSTNLDKSKQIMGRTDSLHYMIQVSKILYILAKLLGYAEIKVAIDHNKKKDIT